MEWLRTIFLMVGSLFIRGLEKRISIADRLAISADGYAKGVRKSLDAAENVGAQARIMADQLSSAKAELHVIEDNMKNALARGDERTAARHAQRIAQMRTFVTRMQEMANAAFGQWDSVRAAVYASVDQLEQLKYQDRMLVMQDHAATALQVLNGLVEQVYQLIPSAEGVAGIRQRVQDEVTLKTAKAMSRQEILRDLAMRKGAAIPAGTGVEGLSQDAREILVQAKRELGLMPMEVPAPAITAPPETKKLEVGKE